MFERMLGAGDLLIESGGEDGQQRFTDIRHPAQVQNLIHAQMEGHYQRVPAMRHRPQQQRRRRRCHRAAAATRGNAAARHPDTGRVRRPEGSTSRLTVTVG